MGIPLEIRRVKRPVNTVITTNGTNSAKRYAVRERIGVKYIPGGNPQPIYGKIIGHIIDFKFVPKVSGGSDANYPLPRSVILFSTDQFSTLSRSSDLLHSDHSFFSF